MTGSGRVSLKSPTSLPVTTLEGGSSDPRYYPVCLYRCSRGHPSTPVHPCPHRPSPPYSRPFSVPASLDPSSTPTHSTSSRRTTPDVGSQGWTSAGSPSDRDQTTGRPVLQWVESGRDRSSAISSGDPLFWFRTVPIRRVGLRIPWSHRSVPRV